MSRHVSRHGDETGYKCNVRPRAHQRAISDDLRAMNREVNKHASYQITFTNARYSMKMYTLSINGSVT